MANGKFSKLFIITDSQNETWLVEMPGPDVPQTGALCATSESMILLFVLSSGLMVCHEKTVSLLGSLGFFFSCFVLSCFLMMFSHN